MRCLKTGQVSSPLQDWSQAPNAPGTSCTLGEEAASYQPSHITTWTPETCTVPQTKGIQFSPCLKTATSQPVLLPQAFPRCYPAAWFFGFFLLKLLLLCFVFVFSAFFHYWAALWCRYSTEENKHSSLFPPFLICSCFSPRSTWESCFHSCIVCPMPLPQAGNSLPSLAESLPSPHEQGFQALPIKHLLHILQLIHTLKRTINICLDFLLILLWHSY